MQFILVAVAPIILILIIHLFILLIDVIHKGINRIIPYPPNFNSTAARIIDPSNGASTWALGNHKWVKYIGILAKNAIIRNKIIENFIKITFDNIKEVLFIQKIILINKGNEAVTVYIIR